MSLTGVCLLTRKDSINWEKRKIYPLVMIRNIYLF